jgi:CRISPR-associated endoribonuclease Cas6
VDIADPDLYAFIVRLETLGSGSLPMNAGHLAQGLFMALVGQVDPELGRALHADQQQRPYTIAIVQPAPERASFRTLRPNQVVVLRITLLNQVLFAPLASALLHLTGTTEIRLGQVRLALREIIGTAAGDPLAGYTTWRGLWSQASSANEATLRFLTPCAISQAHDEENRPRFALLPEPHLLFKSLAGRWNAVAPATLDLDLVEEAARQVVVRHYDLRTVTHVMERKTQVGFLGVCSYELRGSEQQRRLLQTLVDAAFFTGVGIKTARGMGVCHRAMRGRDERS